MTAAVPLAATSWMPTRKWLAALAAGLFTIAGHAVASQGFDTTELGELLTLATSLATAYGVTNR